MKFLLLFLLTPLLLGTACNQPVQRPVQVKNPTTEMPVIWRYDHVAGMLNYRMHEQAVGIEMKVYTQSLKRNPADSHLPLEQQRPLWQKQWGGIPHPAHGVGGTIDRLVATEGFLIHYGQDVTWNRLYGGRKFRWQYKFRLHTNENPWRFEAPVGPVTFQTLNRFPWEPGVTTTTPLTAETQGYLNTGPIAGPFIGCFQQDMDSVRARGLYIRSWFTTAPQWAEMGEDRPPDWQQRPITFTRQWRWVDRQYDGFFAAGASSGMFVHDPRNPPQNRLPSLSSRTDHEVILLGWADGVGPWPRAWERRWWRLAGRNIGAVQNPDGSVRCHPGDWQLDEITGPPELIAWMNEWRTSPRRQPPEGPIDPRLVPAGW
jgi:hypothetical protein